MLDECSLPDNSNLTTLFSQTSALQILKEKSIVAFKLLSEKKPQVLSLLKSISLRQPSLLNIEDEADIN